MHFYKIRRLTIGQNIKESCAQTREAIETHPQTIILSMLAVSSSCIAYWSYYYLMIEHTGAYNIVVNMLHDSNVKFTLTGINCSANYSLIFAQTLGKVLLNMQKTPPSLLAVL